MAVYGDGQMRGNGISGYDDSGSGRQRKKVAGVKLQVPGVMWVLASSSEAACGLRSEALAGYLVNHLGVRDCLRPRAQATFSGMIVSRA